MVKVLAQGTRPIVAKRRRDRERLVREADRLRQAAHPGVVELLGIEELPGGAELRTAWGGRPLASVGPLEVSRLSGLVAHVATTLADLHERGVVHGHLDDQHMLVGTSAPPQLCGLGADDGGAMPADDVAALGGLLTARLSGHPGLEPIPVRRFARPRRDPDAGLRHAVLLLADQAACDVPTRRPTARRLGEDLRAALDPTGGRRSGGLLAAAVRRLPGRARRATVGSRDLGGEDAFRRDPPVLGRRHGVPDSDASEPWSAPDRPHPDPFDASWSTPDRPHPGWPDPSAPGPRHGVPDSDASEPWSAPDRSHHPDGRASGRGADGGPDGELRLLCRPGTAPIRPGRYGNDATSRPTGRTPRSGSPRHRTSGGHRNRGRTGRAVVAALGGAVLLAAIYLVATDRVGGAPAGPSRPAARGTGTSDRAAPPAGGTPDHAVGATTTTVGRRPTVPADPPHACRGADPGTVDVDGDGCDDVVAVADGVVEVGDRRWAVGDPGDVVVVGDWDCDGVATPAALRPATGEVFAFGSWAGREVEVGALDQVDRAVGLEASRRQDGCDALTVTLEDGRRMALDAEVDR
ncbi:MAG: hypothetical protein AB7L84_04945 [Acidimicrobiia bacterium]